MEEATVVNKGDDLMDLPPGFRFHPTDEEIIIHYLTHKVINSSFTASAIGEVDLNKCEPWDLPKKAKMGEKEWYFFCQKDRKYPTGMRTNRATESGYWKATGKDKEIYKGKGSLVGMKKTLVFYRGRAPKGEKSNWVMHEYRLEGKFSYYPISKAAKDEWVVCRIFHKNSGLKKTPIPSSMARMNSFGDDVLDCSSLPPLMDIPGSSFTDGENEFKGISSRSSDNSNFVSYNNIPTNTNYPTPNSIFFPQNIPIQTPISSFQSHQNSAYPSYSIPNFYSHGLGVTDQAILRALAANNEQNRTGKHCKVEQFSSNQSIVSQSQETGISTDINTEISSVVSKQNDMGTKRPYDDDPHDQGPSVGAIEDFEYLWDY